MRNTKLSNKLLVIALAVVCFIVGYGVARFTGGEQASRVADGASEESDIISSGEKEYATKFITYTEVDDANVTIEYTLPDNENNGDESEGFLDKLEDIQESIKGTIKDKIVKEGAGIIIDSIDVSELVALVARVTGYDQAHIWEMQTPHNFAKELLDLNLRECSSKADEDDAANQEFYSTGEAVLFSLKPTSSYGEPESIPTFVNSFDQANASRIYANFKLPPDYANKDVLVKWCKEWPQQRNLIFGPHDINVARNLNYVWYSARQVELGEYYVQVYSSDEKPELLAKGKYSILPSREN